jgi:cell fate regulator YaaT (PSP1 superfamily)
MPEPVEVRFKGIRKGYYRWADEASPLRLRDPVVVEAERGFDFGYVSALGELAARKCGSCTSCAVGPGNGNGDAAEPAEPTPASGESTPSPLVPDSPASPSSPSSPSLPPVIRLATPEDVKQANDLRRGEDEIRRRVAERARSHGLALKVADAEWQWDRKKLTVYFTAEHRVDFRALVRELAAQYHTRIELRQIGVRDEAARIGGVGRCGREYCCSTWLTELSPVSLSLARDQHLSLNPAQISGGCGRLLCCLKYEHEFYVAQRKRFPKEGKTLITARGPERVVAVDILRERLFLRSEAQGPRTILLADLQAELAAASAPTTPAAPAAPPAPVAPPASVAPLRKKRHRKRRKRGPRGPGAPPPGES